MPERADTSRLISRTAQGEPAAAAELVELVYTELRGLARGLLRDRAAKATLQPTALVHEAFLKLADRDAVGWQGRAHFAAVAAKAMRDILVDEVRRGDARKRGGGWHRVTLQGLVAANDDGDCTALDLLDLDEALARLALLDADQARLVELRFFAGMTVREIAAVLDQSRSMVMRRLTLAQAWLLREVDGKAEGGS